jgi:hypothetical protein
VYISSDDTISTHSYYTYYLLHYCLLLLYTPSPLYSYCTYLLRLLPQLRIDCHSRLHTSDITYNLIIRIATDKLGTGGGEVLATDAEADAETVKVRKKKRRKHRKNRKNENPTPLLLHAQYCTTKV